MSDRNYSRRAWAVTGLAVLILVAAAWRYCVTSEAFDAQPPYGTEDLYDWFFPMLDRAYAELRQGRLFLWNPYQLAGLPGLATLQGGLLYPFHIIYAVVPTGVAMGLMGLFHVLLGGLGMVTLLRILGAGPPAALAAGLYFSLAIVMPRYSWPPGMEAVAWLPLGFAGVERTSRNGGTGWMLALVLAMAMPILAGGYQTSAYMLAAYGCYAVALALKRNVPGQVTPSVTASLLRVAICFALGMAVAAPQLLPTAELAQQAARSTQALPLVESNPFGSWSGSASSPAHGLIVPSDALLTVKSYLGVVAVAMAIAGLFVFDRTTFVCLALILYGTLSLLAPPWFVSLRAHIPVLGWFRFPQREFFLAQFAVAVLAARGISLFVDQRGSRWRTGAAAAAGIACMSFGAWYRAGHDSATVAVGGAIILLLAWTLARSERHSAAATVSVLLALLLAYDTVGFSRNSLELPYANDGSRVFSEAQDFYQRLGDLAGPQRVAMLARSDRQLTLKNAQLFGIYSPFDYEPLSPSVHEQCYVHAEPDYPVAGGRGAPRRYFGQPRNRDRSLLLVYPLKRCLDLLSVDVAVVPTRLSQHANIREQWRDIGQAVADIKSDLIGRLDFLRNPNALPRAYAVYDAECLPAGREQWQRLLSPEFDPQTSVVLEQSAGCSERDNAQPARGPDVRIVTLEPMRVRLQTDMNRPGYAVLTDTYYPGWRARVNGESVKILRANGTVRAVRVPAGAVEIVFEYVPMSFYAGTGIAGLAGLFMCCSMWVSRRRAKMVNGRTSQETS